MAIDTRDRRASCVGLALAFRIVLPVADGGLDAGDRQHTAYTYRGIAAGVPEREAFATIFLMARHTTSIRLRAVHRASLRLTARSTTTIRLEAENG